jgi:hypothetical protein
MCLLSIETVCGEFTDFDLFIGFVNNNQLLWSAHGGQSQSLQTILHYFDDIPLQSIDYDYNWFTISKEPGLCANDITVGLNISTSLQ